ncbi:MAG TPA: YifB family Mg chelatase-like AAA ATPase [Chthoniobacteraceae bacterium]|jgi:magnesium chelatase family protein|nr:YifB family Mg chelatase-like AAA ATPase [Chthoniobacteraceae bacterium]
MLAQVFSAAVNGIDAYEVEIEVNTASSVKTIVVVVGLPDVAVKESRDRVTTAVANSGFFWPQGRTTVNLAPADVKKEGPSFDLPIAVGMIAAAQEKELNGIADYCILGELALNGAVRPVKGVLPVAIAARRAGKKALVVPEANAREAAVVDGLNVYGVRNLRETYEFLTWERPLAPVRANLQSLFETSRQYDVDFADVKGQQHAKRAIEVAVAGSHNLLMIGPPGSGKSMLSKRIGTIMPMMTLDEAIDITKIHSICGLLDSTNSFVATRPFRSPHHTISDAGLLGGTANPTPGEISLAHHGILFLDELPEFKRSTLEVMRQPLEDGKVTISRAAGSMTFPAEFMLVAAMNPCPCGYYGDPRRECRCGTVAVQRYRQRISGPLLDRIDLHIEVPAVTYNELSGKAPGEPSEPIRARVETARRIQQERFGKGKTTCNARMTSRQSKEHCHLTGESDELLRNAMSTLNFSARAYDRILKVARTVADLAGRDRIDVEDVSEAIQYRTLDRNLWV